MREPVDYRTAPGASVSAAEREFVREMAEQAVETHGAKALLVNIGVGPGATCWCLRAGAPDAWIVGIDVEAGSGQGWGQFAHDDSRRCHVGFPEPVALLLIDGAHFYEGVRADILNWTPKVAVGGIVVFHDYTRDYTTAPWTAGVRRAVDEWRASWPELGTKWSEVGRADSMLAVRRDE